MPSRVSTVLPLMPEVPGLTVPAGMETGSYCTMCLQAVGGFLVRRTPSTKSQFVLIHCGIFLGWGFTCKIRRLQMPKIWAQNSGSFLGPLGLQKRPFVTLFLYKKNIKKRKPHQRHIHSISPQAIEGPCHPWSCPGVWRKHFTF